MPLCMMNYNGFTPPPLAVRRGPRTYPTGTDSQVYPCKEPASLDLQTEARGAYHPGGGWRGFLGLLAGVFAAWGGR